MTLKQQFVFKKFIKELYYTPSLTLAEGHLGSVALKTLSSYLYMLFSYFIS